MKKFILGCMICIIGFISAFFCFTYAVMNPCIYNGIGGLKGDLLGADLLEPFGASLFIMVIGLGICGWEAYRKK
ncbi:hypothetical protein [Lachnoclostridium phytofermentans]|uniref:Uncharacterized protein n=1 Tax=Lachnoclostridium phytofermentans (strain ATCC 700394 / DSM 18823 / ISDg) TaxID=357809 RepID=A9KK24_LACP7|nr:hypothetical protein [Lachnoclostridium phytofermentans]ABX42596.1 hypothetical protein Cphy_2231 [Lachnoclostridium phytofermentans ISDg]